MAIDKRSSRDVIDNSNALDIEPGVFAQEDAKAIARSLKRSAEHGAHEKRDPYRSAMSMLTLYINRAGSGLSSEHRAVLERAKDELRVAFDREPQQLAR